MLRHHARTARGRCPRLGACLQRVLSIHPVETNPQSTVTAFEGARVITGENTPPLENATILVDGTRILAVGPAASVTVAEGAKRVSLAGKTVMPAIVDTHTHLSQTREALTDDLNAAHTTA